MKGCKNNSYTKNKTQIQLFPAAFPPSGGVQKGLWFPLFPSVKWESPNPLAASEERGAPEVPAGWAVPGRAGPCCSHKVTFSSSAFL